MVDFNNETTITTAPKNVLSIMALQYYNDVLSAIEKYNSNKFNDIDSETNYIQARLLTLYYQFKPSIRIYFKGQTTQLELFYELEHNKMKFKDLLYLFDELNTYLYAKKITKLDDSKSYDATNPFEENKARGFH